MHPGSYGSDDFKTATRIPPSKIMCVMISYLHNNLKIIIKLRKFIFPSKITLIKLDKLYAAIYDDFKL